MEQQKPTILLVDDTPENLDVLTGTLREDYSLKAAINGKGALKLAKNVRPDLILLDIMMPEMDGYEVCERLKADYATRHIPIIFITAKTQQADELKGFELGAVDYITKPFSPPIVKARVRTQIALSDQNRELNRKVKVATESLNKTRMEVIERLGRAAEFKDNETGLHVVRMSYYSRILGLAYGMSEEDADMLQNAAPMHDIGKIGIPDAILQKPGKLTAEEWQVMQSHAQMGAEILGDADSELMSMAQSVALTHHERWDGSGYPRGLKGEEIPIEGRIVALADFFDALTSNRPYKKAWTVEAASQLISENSGTHFDPQLVALYNGAIDEFDEIRQRYLEPVEPAETEPVEGRR